MGQMSLRLATEVRHSLHSMLGFLELAIQEPFAARQAIYLEKCRNGADRLLRVSNDLWEMNQTELGTAEPQTFELATAVAEVVDLLRGQAEHKQLTLEYQPPGQAVLVRGPLGVIQDSLRRLLDNAI